MDKLPSSTSATAQMSNQWLSRFTLGAEHVLEGFDEGVATMRQGERALLTLEPLVAYGSLGARDEKPGVIQTLHGAGLGPTKLHSFLYWKKCYVINFKLLVLKVWDQEYPWILISESSVATRCWFHSWLHFYVDTSRDDSVWQACNSIWCLNHQSGQMLVGLTKEGLASTSRHRCDLRCTFIGGKVHRMGFQGEMANGMPWCWAGIWGTWVFLITKNKWL